MVFFASFPALAPWRLGGSISPMLRRIDRILLRVPALAGAVAYYRDVLGLKLLSNEKHAAIFQLGDGETELVLRDDPDQPDQEIFVLVDDVRGMYERRESLKLNFQHPPRQIARGFRATVKDPFGNVLLLLDRSTQGKSAGALEDAASPTALFAGIEPHTPARQELLIKIYEQTGRTADDLPYTPQFEHLYLTYVRDQDPKPSHQEVWRHLLNLRKGGKLPRLGEARSEAPQVPPGAEEKLRELLGKGIGKRDRLPYSERFDKLVDEFNRTQPRALSPHLVWRIVAKLAK
jgi:catechol 2,3-dioxygenase-like lactoylglutathione lyase family enzyme